MQKAIERRINLAEPLDEVISKLGATPRRPVHLMREKVGIGAMDLNARRTSAD